MKDFLKVCLRPSQKRKKHLKAFKKLSKGLLKAPPGAPALGNIPSNPPSPAPGNDGYHCRGESSSLSLCSQPASQPARGLPSVHVQPHIPAGELSEAMGVGLRPHSPAAGLYGPKAPHGFKAPCALQVPEGPSRRPWLRRPQWL